MDAFMSLIAAVLTLTALSRLLSSPEIHESVLLTLSRMSAIRLIVRRMSSSFCMICESWAMIILLRSSASKRL